MSKHQTRQKIAHHLHPRKCFAQGAWMGNLFICPVCGRMIACGFSGNLFPYPPYDRYPLLVQAIPHQPEWLLADDGWEELRIFMHKLTSCLHIPLEEDVLEDQAEREDASI